MIDPDFLALLRCPDDRSPLREAGPAVVERMNAAIAAGTVRNRVGQALADPIDGGLVRADGTLLYPIREGIPVLILEDAIPLASADGQGARS